MEKKGEEGNPHIAHCLVLAFPATGHINPMLQFSKRLNQKGVKVTLVSTTNFFNKLPLQHFTSKSNHNIQFDTISDGFGEEGGFKEGASFETHLDCFWRVGPQSLAQLLRKLASSSGGGVDCVVYDSVMPWAVDVAQEFGLLSASFFTQSCAVKSIYFHAHRQVLKLPVSDEEGAVVSLPALPKLAPPDLPSFLYRHESYPVILKMVLDQFSNIEKADWILANTFYELEQEVVEWLKKIWPLKTIGPCVPSMFLDKRIQNDTHYGISLNDEDEACMKWLNDKPKRSVVYVSFGTLAALSEEQMEEMGWGLMESDCYFLWVVRASEESKLPKDFSKMVSEKGIMVKWCPQLQVLSHEAVGCFVTHCGWNSTLEALCLGVPMVGIPQWTDQRTNVKFIKDVWKVGITARVDEKGSFTRQEVKQCVKEIMESERGKEMKENAMYWKNMAINAVDEGGSSDKNIEEFVAGLVPS